MATANLSTCAVESCEREPNGARGYCRGHYTRLNKDRPLIKPCLTCGMDHFSFTPYCSEACRPLCVIPGCASRTGKPPHCQRHRESLARRGRLPKWEWSPGKVCVTCGKQDWPDNGFRKYCSFVCSAQYLRNGGQPPKPSQPCGRCGTPIDLLAKGRNGHKTPVTRVVCRHCRRARSLKHRTSVTILVARDGTKCGICNDDVDLDLKFPSPWSPSVDHIHPFSFGGTDDLENLQLAHLRCNRLKSNKVDAHVIGG